MAGYIKRVPVSTYRAQRRGGKGRAGMATRDEDFVSQRLCANTHPAGAVLLVDAAWSYKMKVYKLPLGTPQARGKALINLLPLDPGETITTLWPLPEDEEAWARSVRHVRDLRGNVRRNSLSDFTNVMSNGKIAMKLNDGDHWFGSARAAETTTCYRRKRQSAFASRSPMYACSRAEPRSGCAVYA